MRTKAYKRPTRPVPTVDHLIRQHLGAQLRRTYELDTVLPASLRSLVSELARALFDRAESSFEAELMGVLPHLRAFALSLAGSPDRADDLVQQTVLKALRNLDKFEPGTNLQGWLFVILRNEFRTEWRKKRPEVPDPEGIHAEQLATPPAQEDELEHQDLLAALEQLPLDQRATLLLVGAQGRSYDEAAAICRVPVGTTKSRLNRARKRLAQLLDREDVFLDRFPNGAA